MLLSFTDFFFMIYEISQHVEVAERRLDQLGQEVVCLHKGQALGVSVKDDEYVTLACVWADGMLQPTPTHTPTPMLGTRARLARRVPNTK